MNKHIVIYFHNPGPRDQRIIESVFERPSPHLDRVLPFVSVPLTQSDMDTAIARLADSGVVLVQAASDEPAIATVADAMARLRQNNAWSEMLVEFEVTMPHAIDVEEADHCWLVLVDAVEDGMPPGEGFVIDKVSGRVISHRYVDVAHAIAQHRDRSRSARR